MSYPETVSCSSPLDPERANVKKESANSSLGVAQVVLPVNSRAPEELHPSSDHQSKSSKKNHHRKQKDIKSSEESKKKEKQSREFNCFKEIVDPRCGLKLPNCYHASFCYITLIIIGICLTLFFLFGHLAFISIPPQCVCPEIEGYKKVIKESSDWEFKAVCDYKFKDNNTLAFTRIYEEWGLGEGNPDKDRNDNKYYLNKKPPIDGKCRRRLGLIYMYAITVPMGGFGLCVLVIIYNYFSTCVMFCCKNDRSTNDAIYSCIINEGDNCDLILNANIEIFWPIVCGNICFVIGVILGFVLIVLAILAIVGFIVISPILLICFIIVLIVLLIYWTVSYCKCTNSYDDSPV